MKIRLDLITNSSSGSFILLRKYLTKEQESKILSYNDRNEDGWDFDITEDWIKGSTSMDNGCLAEYMESLNIDMSKSEWFGD